MGLKELNLQIQYRSEEDDIVRDFYQKVIQEAVEYKRAVGYFSTKSLLLLGEALDDFILRNSKMKLIASPELSDEDLEIIKNGYEQRKNIVSQTILNSLFVPTDEKDKLTLSKVEYMIAKGNLDIKIAFRNKKGIFHEKIGIVIDNNKDKVAFNGSINETYNGYHENFESLDLYFSWDDRDALRINNKEKNFDDLWENKTKNLEIYDFTDVIHQRLISFKKQGDIPEISKCEFECDSNKDRNPHVPEWFEKGIRPYQVEAYNSWVQNGYSGILQMATGTGKTLTACYSLVKLYERLKNANIKQVVIVVAPLKHLVDQWSDELKNFGYNPFSVYGEIKNWEVDINNASQQLALDRDQSHLSIVVTKDSFMVDRFQTILNKLKSRHPVALVIDEAHNFGANNIFTKLPDKNVFKLGLTATPIRHNDEVGTKKLINYFKGIVFKYDLEQAIENGYLTKYYYYPIVVYLDTKESKQYYDYLSEFNGYSLDELKQFSYSNTAFKDAMKLTYSIADGSINKFRAFKKLINDFSDTYYNLVYCNSVSMNTGENKLPIKQIDAIRQYMGKELSMHVHNFTNEENAELKRELIKRFASGEDIQALVAIKCLDEGVDIPATKRAFILSSTTNEKQFVQRRGRVLRKFEGKEYAEIYDFITLPRSLDDVLKFGITSNAELFLIIKEYKRVLEYSRLAINSELGKKLTDSIYQAYKLEQNLVKVGKKDE